MWEAAGGDEDVTLLAVRARSDDREAPKEASPRVLVNHRDLSRPKSILRKTPSAAVAPPAPSRPPPDSDSPTNSGHTQMNDSNAVCCVIL